MSGRAALPAASLVCQRHVEMAVRCLGSLIRHCRAELELTVFDDGTLDDRDAAILQAALPGAAIVRASANEACVEHVLAAYPKCREFRRRSPLLRKLLDVPISMKRPYLFCDADVLFLSPFELREFQDRLSQEFIFMRDIREGYSAGLRQFVFAHRLRILSKANTGFMGVPIDRYDLDFAEWFLGMEKFAVFPNMLEQTCWAAMPRGEGARMIDERQLSCFRAPGRISREAVGVHFIGAGKEQLSAWPDLAPKQSATSGSPADLRLAPAAVAGWRHIVGAGLRNRLLPPHRR